VPRRTEAISARVAVVRRPASSVRPTTPRHAAVVSDSAVATTAFAETASVTGFGGTYAASGETGVPPAAVSTRSQKSRRLTCSAEPSVAAFAKSAGRYALTRP